MTKPSHPPTLTTLAKRAIAGSTLFGASDRVLVAVSGGPDSMALLHVLSRLRASFRFDLWAHGVDHGLRADAGRELDVAAALAESLGVPFGRSVVAVSPGGNLQARARAARYAALEDAAQQVGACRIATAHHADDRAETVLMRLLRGAGPRGLAVLPPRAGHLVRPFVRARRADILAHVRRHGLPFAEDPSNVDPRFLRSRVRHELMPAMERLSPGIVAHLCALADQLIELDHELDDRVDRGEPPLPHMHTLPRAARAAIRQMVRTGSKKTRVRLPGGRVASYDPSRSGVTVESFPASLECVSNVAENIVGHEQPRGRSPRRTP